MINQFKKYLIFFYFSLNSIPQIDYDISFGKENPYFAPFYEDCFNSNTNAKKWAYFARPFDKNYFDKICRDLYKKNNLSKVKASSNKIPKIIHQIWLGSPLPDRYKKWQKSWQNIPGWEYKIWTDEDVKNLNLKNKKIYDNSKNYGERADILRIEILNQFGGVYVDTDFECINPEMLTHLNCCYDFYAGLHPLDSQTYSLVNALIGSTANHPILEYYLQNLRYQKSQDIIIKTGPGLFTKSFINGCNIDNKINIAFPPTFFYPLGNQQLKNLKEINYEEIKKNVKKEETIAIHWWESSWEKDGAKVQKPCDLTIVGQAIFAESMARLSIGLIDSLKDELKINFIPTRSNKSSINLKEIPKEVQSIILNHDKSPGKVALLLDGLWYTYTSPYKDLPNSLIKIAYSMTEADTIPPLWVEILNNNFDAVAVPDAYYENVYTKCGVKIPIFVLPHPMYLEDFLKEPLKAKSSTPFNFGVSAALWPRKNQDTLIEAFAQEFGSDPNVCLKIHARTYHLKYKQKIEKLINKHGLKNVNLIRKIYNKAEYLNFLKSLDCYIAISKAEGFSLTPREAIALGLPCIVSNNTAQKTICESRYVLPVNSEIEEDACDLGFDKAYGSFFNCEIADVRYALREIYTNYTQYLNRSPYSREWVKQYSYSNLKNKYLNLIKPKKVILGSLNMITDEYLMTNDQSLYDKYIS